MDDLSRLKLLARILEETKLDTVESLGVLANDVESLRFSLGPVSEQFAESFAALWGALEVVAVRHQEEGTAPTAEELHDLDVIKREFSKHTTREITERAS
jgi:hypothetical protein